jgi:hypothetical protein
VEGDVIFKRPSLSSRAHGAAKCCVATCAGSPCPKRVLCHERSRSTRLRATVREMKEGPSGSAIRSLIPSHRELLRSKAVVVSVAETSGQ